MQKIGDTNYADYEPAAMYTNAANRMLPGENTTAADSTTADSTKTAKTDAKAKTAAVSKTDSNIKPGYRSSPADCETCRNRKYQDGSDENVSYKSAAHISVSAAPAAVRGHEQEHVSNAYTKAAQKGGQVMAVSVAIHTGICPECGRTYVSGGTTSYVIRYPKENTEKSAESAENFTT